MVIVLFILFFTILPLVDFKENYMDGYDVQIGYVFHYISIACFTFTIYQMHRAITRSESNITYSKVLNTVLLSLAIVYLSSIELMLHVFKLVLSAADSLEVKNTQYDITRIHIIKIGFPILWGMLSFLFLFIGMKKSNKTFRIVALVLIAINLLKLFTYDIKDASEAGKIVAFIILGVVLLIISFMYQKIKALLLDDIKKQDELDNAEPKN